MIVYLNGLFVSEDQATLSIYDRGFLLGDGVFETIGVKCGQIECLKAHETLLHQAARVLRIPYPEPEVSFQEIISHLIQVNDLHNTHAAARITLTRGPGRRGLLPEKKPDPTLLVTTVSYARPERPWHITLAQDPRVMGRLTSIKHLGYQSSILAYMEAHEQGFDDALFFNQRDELVSSTLANVFVFSQGYWLTPPIQSGARPGVMRARVLQKGFAKIQKISREMVINGIEAMVLTNSLMGIQPVQMLKDKELDLHLALALQEDLQS